tara:strand:+ start:823 stop:1128 length:306 start_codon:yes stop_codon:yes gene_type:complete
MDDMKPNDLANLMTVGAAALGSLLLIIFKSRCTNIDCSFLWGLFRYNCIRTVNNDSSDEEDNKDDKKNEKKPVLPNKTGLLNKQLNDKIKKEKPPDNIIQE